MATPDVPDIAAILDRYERPLVRYAMSIVGDVESARDVVQDTFIKLARLMADREESESASGQEMRGDSRSPLYDEKHLEAWLFTVCRHRAIDHQRRYSRIIPMPLPEDRTSDERGPDEFAEGRDTEANLLRLLDRLSANQREVIRLKFQNDLSYQEIADITHLSVTNVGFLLHTGLRKLREILKTEPAYTDLALRSLAS
jgi:RNA polymerase sigma-70 factor (ECF subfamily)